MYGSSGEITIELAIGEAGGYENTCHNEGLDKAVASVLLRVVMEVISPPFP
jgi:hypothetical protein